MVECKGFLIDEDCNIFNKRTGRKLKQLMLMEMCAFLIL